MKKEVRLLLKKSLDSLLLTIELFNRPSDCGRIDHVMMNLDHAFEMFLKAGILHKGGLIRENGRSRLWASMDVSAKHSLMRP